MKTLLLNDTSWYHYGCKEVINNLKNYYNPTATCDNRETIELSELEKYDLVVLNGEGTLHHDAPWAKKFLSYLQEAQVMGKQTHLINSVWQQMSGAWKAVAARCDIVEVREILSQKEIECDCEIVLDASLHSEVEFIPMEEFHEVCLGGDFYKKLYIDWEKYNRIDIFNTPWVELVNTLRNTKLLITGRHHEMYAALKARTRTITVPSNTWKNEGFFYTMGVPELIIEPTRDNIEKTLNGYYDVYWNRVWEKLNNLEYKYGTQ